MCVQGAGGHLYCPVKFPSATEHHFSISLRPICPSHHAHMRGGPRPCWKPSPGLKPHPRRNQQPHSLCGLPDTTAPGCHLALRPRHPILLLAAPGHLPQAGCWPAGQGTWASSSSKEAPKQHGSGIWQELKDLSHGRRNR